MTDRVFVDSNVWVYAVDADEPTKQARAREVLDPATSDTLVTSAQVLGEFYVTVTRKLGRPVADDIAARMVDRMAQLPVVAIDADGVQAAIAGSRSWQLSYWDALIVVAAQSAGCRRLLSEDLADGTTYGSVRVENPFVEQRRASEAPPGYGALRGPWDDAGLLAQLARYEDVCRAAGMRQNAVHSYWDYARRFLAWRMGDYQPRGAIDSGRPVPVGPVSTADLEAQAASYALAIEAAGREQATVDTYLRHAMFFIRWLRGDFEPGRRLRPARRLGLRDSR
jgi:predicted nucleic acid-binding protein